MLLLSPKLQVKNKAFTLVELMVVILIIGILVTIMAGAVVKWMAWQRDPTNPNSSVSQTINTIKQAVTRITQDIQQKAKQDYQALSAGDKVYYQTLSNNLFNPPSVGLITEPDPNTRAILVYANTQIVKNFPAFAAAIYVPPLPAPPTLPNFVSTPVYNFDCNLPAASLTRIYNCYAFPTPPTMTALSLAQQLLTANTIKKNVPSVASTPNRDSSACLLVALESHPKGLKVEDLGSGSISIEGSGTNAVRFIQPGGVVIYHKIHYVDTNDNNADKSFKVGSLRVDIAYDTE
jgi:prepilin-type N-terminal cleavage/methylation domain-containing protein